MKKFDYFRFDVRDRPMSIARVYSDQTLFDEPTRAVMNVTAQPAQLIISKLIPADSGKSHSSRIAERRSDWSLKIRRQTLFKPNKLKMTKISVNSYAILLIS